MKKNQESKGLTLDEKKEFAWKQMELLCRQRGFGNPTYEFKVGDQVRVGNLKDCVIKEKTSYKGNCIYGYTFNDASMNNNVGFQYSPWYHIRPYEIGRGETAFSKEDSVRIQFYNTSLESLLNKFYLSGVDMNPVYQRDYVWDDKDKEALLDSIFNHIEIGKFAFIQRDYSFDVGYEILDGKQRLSTLLDFYENRLAYKGVYYNDLSAKDRFTFLNTPVSVGETNNLSMEQIYEYFYKLNRCGKVMSEEHLKKIKENILDTTEEKEDFKL